MCSKDSEAYFSNWAKLYRRRWMRPLIHLQLNNKPRYFEGYAVTSEILMYPSACQHWTTLTFWLFLLSHSWSVLFRMWNINTGACVKIFNGHTRTIICLDMYKNKFVSGAKDCTAKRKQVKSTARRGLICCKKINRTHIVPLKTNMILFTSSYTMSGVLTP